MSPDIESSASGEIAASADFPAPLAVNGKLRDYEIQELVGSGGFGFVYRATDRTLQRDVAIKEYFPKFIAIRGVDGQVQPRLKFFNARSYRQGLENFLREARVLAQVDDPSIVKVHLFWEQDGTGYMVMPFYEGITLRRLARHHRNLISADWLCAFLRHAMRALAALHRSGIYHRDLSPENILILESGGMVLLDFGASHHQMAQVSATGEVVLKPGYAPIEQYLASEQLAQGPWTDLYGLGAVLHFLLAGQPPPAAIARTARDGYRQLAACPASQSQASHAILAAIDRCLSLQPHERPQSVDELRALMALDEHPVAPDFDLYRGVTKATKCPAITALADETERTIPLDPVEILPRGASPTSPSTPEPCASAHPAESILPVPDAGEGGAVAAQFVTGDMRLNAHLKADAQPVPVPARRQRAWPVALAAGLAGLVLCAMYLVRSLPSKQHAAQARTAVSDVQASLLSAPAEASAAIRTIVPPQAKPTPNQPPRLATEPAAFERPAIRETAPAPPRRSEASQELPPPAKPANAVLQLQVKPWGTLSINGETRGAAPPLKRIKLPPGKYRIEISNPGFPSYKTELEFAAGGTTVIKHTFE